jgi:hypothetical protein
MRSASDTGGLVVRRILHWIKWRRWHNMNPVGFDAIRMADDGRKAFNRLLPSNGTPKNVIIRR